MPPAGDDDRITGDRYLLRALLPRWLTIKVGRERPTSDSLLDSSFENSCFIEDEITVAQVQGLFPGLKLARIPVELVRRHHFAVERRPNEAPQGCPVPDAHVVIGPLQVARWGDYERSARNIVKDPVVQLIPPNPPPGD